MTSRPHQRARRWLRTVTACVLAASSATAQTSDKAKVRETYERLCTGNGGGGAAACAALKAELDGSSVPAPSTASAEDSALRIRATYERLCTGEGQGSIATCKALRTEFDNAGVPGEAGWLGLFVSNAPEGVKAAYASARFADSPAARADIRSGDLVIAMDGKSISSGDEYLKALQGKLQGQLINVRLIRGGKVIDVPIKLAAKPPANFILNSERTARRSYSLWDGVAPSVDRVKVGEAVYGVLEASDASPAWGERKDCYEVPDALSRNLRATVVAGQSDMKLSVHTGSCPVEYGPIWTYRSDLDFKAGAGKTYVSVMGPANPKPYVLIVREQTPQETQAWRDRVRRQQIADQEQRAADERAANERASMFGAMFTGLVLGAAGAEMPAMGSGGSSSLLSSLNAATAAMQKKNEESAAQLNATIARAQADAAAQQRRQAQAGSQPDKPSTPPAPAATIARAPQLTVAAKSAPAPASKLQSPAPISPSRGQDKECVTRKMPDGLPSAWLPDLAAAKAQAEDWARGHCGVETTVCNGPIVCNSMNNFGTIVHSCVQPATRMVTAYCGDGSPSRVTPQ